MSHKFDCRNCSYNITQHIKQPKNNLRCPNSDSFFDPTEYFMQDRAARSRLHCINCDFTYDQHDIVDSVRYCPRTTDKLFNPTKWYKKATTPQIKWIDVAEDVRPTNEQLVKAAYEEWNKPIADIKTSNTQTINEAQRQLYEASLVAMPEECRKQLESGTWEKPMEKTKFETGATRSSDTANVAYHLISPIGLRRIAETYKEGADKHEAYNWEKGMPISDILNHQIRHIYLYLSGDRSEDHLAHSGWNALAAMHMEETHPELDHGLRKPTHCTPEANEQYREALETHFHRHITYYENTDTHLVIKFREGDSLVYDYEADASLIRQLPDIKIK